VPWPPPFRVTILVIPSLVVVFAVEPVVSAVRKLGLEVNVAREESVVIGVTEPGDPVLSGPAPDIMPVYVWL
jgi:hypothetical protein